MTENQQKSTASKEYVDFTIKELMAANHAELMAQISDLAILIEQMVKQNNNNYDINQSKAETDELQQDLSIENDQASNFQQSSPLMSPSPIMSLSETPINQASSINYSSTVSEVQPVDESSAISDSSCDNVVVDNKSSHLHDNSELIVCRINSSNAVSFEILKNDCPIISHDIHKVYSARDLLVNLLMSFDYDDTDDIYSDDPD